MKKFECGNCGATKDVPAGIVKRRPAIWCDCGAMMSPARPKSRGKTNAQKRSRDQEKRAAKTFGMKTQPASGASPWAKSDLRRFGRLRGEAKETTNKSFSLKLEELEKLEREATGGEFPLFMVEFQGVHPFKRYVVAPEWVVKYLVDENDTLREEK